MKINDNAVRGLRAAIAVLFLLSLAGCSSKLVVRSEIDQNADFGAYRTWNFFDTLGIEGGNNSPVYGEHFRAAIEREMSSRGYRMADQPDLLVNVTFRADEGVKMSAFTRPYLTGAYYGGPGGASYGSALGVGVGIGGGRTAYTEASVFIDLVDNRTDRMVWQGVAVAEVDDKVARALRDAIYTVVDRVFARYPHRAGG